MAQHTTRLPLWKRVQKWGQTPAPLLCLAGVLFGRLATLLLPPLCVYYNTGAAQARWCLLLAGVGTLAGLGLTTLRQPFPLLLALLLYADAAAIAGGLRFEKRELLAMLVVFTGVAAALVGAAVLLETMLRP